MLSCYLGNFWLPGSGLSLWIQVQAREPQPILPDTIKAATHACLTKSLLSSSFSISALVSMQRGQPISNFSRSFLAGRRPSGKTVSAVRGAVNQLESPPVECYHQIVLAILPFGSAFYSPGPKQMRRCHSLATNGHVAQVTPAEALLTAHGTALRLRDQQKRRLTRDGSGRACAAVKRPRCWACRSLQKALFLCLIRQILGSMDRPGQKSPPATSTGANLCFECVFRRLITDTGKLLTPSQGSSPVRNLSKWPRSG